MRLLLCLLAGLAAVATAVKTPLRPARWSRWTNGADNCTVPNWIVRHVNVTYSAETDVPGSVSFEVTDTVTQHTAELGCPIVFNYRCNSTDLGYEGLDFNVQTSIDTFYLGINDTQPCGNTTASSSPAFVYGYVEMPLQCPEDREPDMTCTAEFGQINGTMYTGGDPGQ